MYLLSWQQTLTLQSVHPLRQTKRFKFDQPRPCCLQSVVCEIALDVKTKRRELISRTGIGPFQSHPIRLEEAGTIQSQLEAVDRLKRHWLLRLSREFHPCPPNSD